MKYLFIVFSILIISAASGYDAKAIEAINAQVKNKDSTRPEDFGFSSQQLNLLGEFLESAGSSSFLLLREGQEVYRWGTVDKKHVIHSIRKPLVSALYGKYIGAGLIDPMMSLADNNIDDISPSLSAIELSATVSDLLKSRSGVYHDAAANSPEMIRHRPERNTQSPGEYYFYNNWDFNVLGALLEQKTGKSVFTLFLEDIAIPLGMKQYKGKFASIDGEDDSAKIPDTDGFYQYENTKSKYPAYHFRMSAIDLAKFGQLYLNQGKWNGEQIFPNDWVDTSTQPYSVTNANYGIAYGMLWNVLMETDKREHRAFYHTGNGIHFLGIYPHSQVVIVHRVDTEKPYQFNQQNFYQMINKVWAAYSGN